MLTEQHRKESLSRAYVRAIAGQCGLICSHADVDYGIDVTLHEVTSRNGRLVHSGYSLDVQLKSTVTAVVEDSHVKYDLEVKNYLDLCETDVGCPRILVLLVLPRPEPEWLSQTEEELIVRRCAYWLSLRGKPASSNTATVRIQIPRTNVLSVEGLRAMMAQVRKGVAL